MKMKTVFLRFYKSFNFDYERWFAATSRPKPWESVDDAWYPYVRISLDPSVTTIVGANESGKSHLLDAIQTVITGNGTDRSDFCRYSHFFSVEQGKLRQPDFGAEFEINDGDSELIKQHFSLTMRPGESFHLFRPNGNGPVIYGADGVSTELDKTQTEALGLILPAVFRLDADIPLPSSISLHQLASEVPRPPLTRRARGAVLQRLERTWQSADDLRTAAPEILNALETERSDDIEEEGYRLGKTLLFDVAKVDPEIVQDLLRAISEEKEGYVNGIIQKINDGLARYLNFPRWWAQDRDFRLMVSPREYDLVFTIRDRTGTDYSFSERSNGLKYFLSYHVQLLAHRPPANGRPEILLMDEPDAYLSSQGQQDLLRILEAFAQPEDRSREAQVIYVTHSPFLINRNAAERIRVLDKGEATEGTRVVTDAARNHYEPLRSSLGVFAAETSFIGGANLFVEGLADQVLLAGISSHLRAVKVSTIDTLDLNSVTIVPSGSASSIPYLVYLARGRDVIKPPCVALLDSDDAGNEAAKTLDRGGPRGKQLLKPEFVTQVGSWASSQLQNLAITPGVIVTELEDLISVPVAVEAARNYAKRVLGLDQETLGTLAPEDVVERLAENRTRLFDALEAAFRKRLGETAHIEKVGFAKEVVAVLAAARDAASKSADVVSVENNFGLLVKELAGLLRAAQEEEQSRRRNNQLDRIIKRFLDDYPSPTTREHGRLLVESLERSVEDGNEGDRVKLQLAALRRDFDLDEDLNKPIDRFDEFRKRVAALRYEERFANQETGEEEGKRKGNEKRKGNGGEKRKGRVKGGKGKVKERPVSA